MNIFDNLESNYLETKANRLLNKGKAEEAITIYNKITKINDNKVSAHWNKMAAFIKLEKFDQALLCLNKLIELNPENVKFYFQKASILGSEKLQRYDEAIVYYDMVLKIQKTFYAAYLGKGIALACLHKYDEADECYDKAIELYPKDPWIYSNKAIVLLKKKMYQDALELCDRAIKQSSKTKMGLDFAYFTKSRVYGALNKKDECIANISKAISINSSVKNKVFECKEFDFIKNDNEFINIVSN